MTQKEAELTQVLTSDRWASEDLWVSSSMSVPSGFYQALVPEGRTAEDEAESKRFWEEVDDIYSSRSKRKRRKSYS